jgi:hypothetical protein
LRDLTRAIETETVSTVGRFEYGGDVWFGLVDDEAFNQVRLGAALGQTPKTEETATPLFATLRDGGLPPLSTKTAAPCPICKKDHPVGLLSYGPLLVGLCWESLDAWLEDIPADVWERRATIHDVLLILDPDAIVDGLRALMRSDPEKLRGLGRAPPKFAKGR